jgi:hypothetical protein
MTLTRAKWATGIFIAVAAVLGFVLWPKGTAASIEDLVRQKVVVMARAAEKKDLGFIMDQVSERFVSAEGWHKQELKQVLAYQLLRGNWVRVFIVDLKTSATSPNSATMSGKFIFGRSEATSLKELAKSTDMSSYLIQAKLEKEGDQWKFVSAIHRALDPSEFL